MKRRDLLLYGGLASLLTIALVVLFFVGPGWLTSTSPETAETAPAPSEERKIRARLFFVSEEGTRLSAVEQEVTYGEGTVEQAKRIVEAQIATPTPPLASAIPPGTRLKGLFLTPSGDAYVDLTPEVRANHPGGTTSEILTVYALVNALTSNLPAITGVQILIDGKEADTLAGHLDLRRPIEHDSQWVTQ
jgi:spore germination protein GerM